MATRNERKKRAKANRTAIAKSVDAKAQSNNVRAIVLSNLAKGMTEQERLELRAWQGNCSPMGDLKGRGTSGRVCGLSRLAPVPDAKGRWTDYVG